MNAGNRVELVRLELGLSQDQLAAAVRKLGGDISQTGIDKIEKRDAKRPRCLPELADALGVSEHWLMTGKGQRAREMSIDKQLRQLPEKDSERIIATVNDLIKAVKLRTKIGGDSG